MMDVTLDDDAAAAAADTSSGTELDDTYDPVSDLNLSDPNIQNSIVFPSQRPKWNLWKVWSQHIFKELNFHKQTGYKLYSKMGLARLFYDSVDVMGGFNTLYNKIVNNHYFIVEIITKTVEAKAKDNSFKLLLETKSLLSDAEVTSQNLDIVVEDNLAKCLDQTFELGDYALIWGGDITGISLGEKQKNPTLHLNKANGTECLVMHYRHDGQMPLTNEHGAYEYPILGSDISHQFYAGASEEVTLVQHIKPKPIFSTPVSNVPPIPSTSRNQKEVKATSTNRLINTTPILYENITRSHKPRSARAKPITRAPIKRKEINHVEAESDAISSESPVCVDITLSSDEDAASEADAESISKLNPNSEQSEKTTPENEENNQSVQLHQTTITVNVIAPTPKKFPVPDLLTNGDEGEQEGEHETLVESMEIGESEVPVTINQSPENSSIATSPEYETADEDSQSLPLETSSVSPEKGSGSKVLQDVFLNGTQEDIQERGEDLNQSVEEGDKGMEKIETPTKVNGANSSVENEIDSQPFSLDIYNEIETQMEHLFSQNESQEPENRIEEPQLAVALTPQQTKNKKCTTSIETLTKSPSDEDPISEIEDGVEPEMIKVSERKNGFGVDSFVTPHDETSHISILDENIMDAPLPKGGRRKSRIHSSSSSDSDVTDHIRKNKKRIRTISDSSNDSIDSTKTVDIEKARDILEPDTSGHHSTTLDYLVTPALDDPNKSLNAAKRRLDFPEPEDQIPSTSNSQKPRNQHEVQNKYQIKEFKVVCRISQQNIVNELSSNQTVYIGKDGRILFERSKESLDETPQKSTAPLTSTPLERRKRKGASDFSESEVDSTMSESLVKTKSQAKRSKGKKQLVVESELSESDNESDSKTSRSRSSSVSSGKVKPYKKQILAQGTRATRNRTAKNKTTDNHVTQPEAGPSRSGRSQRLASRNRTKSKQIDVVDLIDDDDEEVEEKQMVKPNKKRSRRN